MEPLDLETLNELLRLDDAQRAAAATAATASAPPQSCSSCCWPVSPKDRHCPACGIPLPGREARTIAGLRPRQAMLGLAVVLAAIAAGGYVALHARNNSTRSPRPVATSPTSAQLADAPTHTVTASPVTPAVATSPPRAVAPRRPKVTHTAVPASSARSPVTPQASTVVPPTTAPPETTAATTTTATKAPPAAIPLTSGDVTNYNPDGASSSSLGKPANALGSSPWTYQLDPNNPGSVLVGLVIHLPSPKVVGTISLETDTPGMSVEFYGTTGTPPNSIRSSKWILLTRRSSITQSAAVRVYLHKAFANLLVWITKAPPATTVGTVDIAKLSVTG